VDVLEHGGVYLFSVEHDGGYLVYCAGHTQHFRRRFRQHDRLYWDGTYSIFDHDAFAAGKRKKVWPGFWMKKSQSPELREDFILRASEIKAATKRWLDGYRVFVAPIDLEKRIRQRLEAGLMAAFMKAEPPACDMTDTGMSLSSRWPWEATIHVRNVATDRILGLPAEMEV
jgi:hypothetical protein